MLTGRIAQGEARINMPVKALAGDGRVIEEARLTKLLAFRGLDRRPIEEAEAGDIIAIAGLADRDRRRHDLRRRAGDGASFHADRSADPGDDVLGQ